MRKLLLIIILALLGMPVLALDEDSPNLNLYHRAKLYGAEILAPTWEAYYLFFIPEVQADVYWTSYGDLAVIGINQTIFSDSEQEEAYFDDMTAYFDAVFQNYSPYQITASCGSDELTLREFTALNGGQDYLIKHYIEQIGTHEIRVIALYFPLDLAAELNQTAALFYPDLPSCTED